MRRKVQVWIHTADCSRVLVLKTNAQRQAFWQPVTGGVEKEESYEQAAEREAREETALSFNGPPVDLGYEFSFKSQWGDATERVFALETETPLAPILDPNEHQAFEWVTTDEAYRRLQFPSNAEGLRRLEARWRRLT